MQPPNSLIKKSISCDSCSLNSICLPNGLTENELDQLELLIDKTVKIKKKESLYLSTEQSKGIYAIKSGAIKTSIANAEGLEQVLEFHLPGDMLGFDAFNNGIHTCNAIALEDTLLCKISTEAFDDMYERIPILRREMIHQVGKEIAHNQSLLLSLGQQQTDERLATFLLYMSTHFQSRGFSGKEFVIPMPRQDLSNYLGMAVETLSRIISRLTDNGIVEIDRRLVTIINMEKLEELANTSCHR